MAPRRGGTGRKNTVIQRIVNEESMNFYFSKRRRGLFKKVRELALAVLSGGQVDAIAFSPGGGGNAFSLGHPSVDAAVERFVQGAADDSKLHRQLAECRAELRKWKKKGAADAMAKEDRMTGEELAAFVAELIKVKAERANQVLVDVSPKPKDLDAGMDMQEMMPPPQGFDSSMDMQEMMMALPPPPGFDDGMDMQEMMMALPPPQVFDAGTGMDMQQMMMALPPPQGFDAVMDMHEMMLALPPP